jgi:hypothetical protein
MKMRRWVFYLCISLALFGGLQVLLIRGKIKRQEEMQAGTPPSTSSKILNSVPVADSSPKTVVESIKHDVKQQANQQLWLQRQNGAVQFYAKVVDQHGSPVAGAKLVLNLSRYVADDKNPVRDERIGLLSDTAGQFDLKTLSGHSLRIVDLTANGYLWSYPADVGSFDFSMYRPRSAQDYQDPDKRFVLHLWKKEQTEPIIRQGVRIPLSGEQETYGVNLFTGKKVGANELADLLVRIPLVEDAAGVARGDRWFIFEVPNGGIVETADVYPYAAPRGGYAPQWKWRHEIGKTNSEQWRRNFYAKLRNGQTYAGLTITWGTAGTAFEVQAIINPHSSPMLEPEASKEITDLEEIRRLDTRVGQ